MLTFNDFSHSYTYKLKNKATSTTKYYQVLSSLSLSYVGTCLRDRPFSSDIATINLHLSK